MLSDPIMNIRITPLSSHLIAPKYKHSLLKQTLLLGLVAVVATVCAYIFLDMIIRVRTNLDASRELAVIPVETHYSFQKTITELSGAISLVAAKKALGCLNLNKSLSHYEIEPVPIVLNQDLMQIFERKRRADMGVFGHARVLQVVDKPTRSLHAMKIFWPSIKMWYPKTKRWYFENIINEVASIAKVGTNKLALSIIRTNAMKELFTAKKLSWHHFHDAAKMISGLLENGITPHLVKPEMTLAAHTFLTKSSENLFEDIPEGPLHTILISEWVDSGDLKNNYTDYSKNSHVMFHLQNLHTIKVLERSNIVVQDNACHNRFLSKLTKQHCFRGKLLANFDFWKYRVEGIEFYIPRPSHLLKLGDFDDWFKLPYFSKLPLKQDTSKSIEALASEIATSDCIHNLTETDALAILNRWTQKPKAKILDMSTD